MKQLEALSRFAGVALRVLPDFLLDHSLLEAEPEHRLPELCGRMVDLVQRLHGWGEQSVFCLRLDHLPDKGAIRLALLARPPAPQRRAALQRDLIAALRVFGIIGMADDYGRCLPLMTPAALAALPMAPGRRAWLAREIVDTFVPSWHRRRRRPRLSASPRMSPPNCGPTKRRSVLSPPIRVLAEPRWRSSGGMSRRGCRSVGKGHRAPSRCRSAR